MQNGEIISIQKKKHLEETSLHLLPCTVESNGVAPVSDYFNVRETGIIVNNSNVFESAFRGRKFYGRSIKIDDDFEGIVLKPLANTELKAHEMNEVIKQEWITDKKFQNFIYWNHDDHPTASDGPSSCLEWLEISKAVNAEIPADEILRELESIEKNNLE